VERSLLPHVREDLETKIVLISGPRQVYLNFDAEDDRRMILDRSWARGVDLVILDEIHIRYLARLET
jgi:replicative superfamily II helicase